MPLGVKGPPNYTLSKKTAIQFLIRTSSACLYYLRPYNICLKFASAAVICYRNQCFWMLLAWCSAVSRLALRPCCLIKMWQQHWLISYAEACQTERGGKEDIWWGHYCRNPNRARVAVQVVEEWNHFFWDSGTSWTSPLSSLISKHDQTCNVVEVLAQNWNERSKAQYPKLIACGSYPAKQIAPSHIKLSYIQLHFEVW